MSRLHYNSAFYSFAMLVIAFLPFSAKAAVVLDNSFPYVASWQPNPQVGYDWGAVGWVKYVRIRAQGGASGGSITCTKMSTGDGNNQRVTGAANVQPGAEVTLDLEWPTATYWSGFTYLWCNRSGTALIGSPVSGNWNISFQIADAGGFAPPSTEPTVTSVSGQALVGYPVALGGAFSGASGDGLVDYVELTTSGGSTWKTCNFEPATSSGTCYSDQTFTYPHTVDYSVNVHTVGLAGPFSASGSVEWLQSIAGVGSSKPGMTLSMTPDVQQTLEAMPLAFGVLSDYYLGVTSITYYASTLSGEWGTPDKICSFSPAVISSASCIWDTQFSAGVWYVRAVVEGDDGTTNERTRTVEVSSHYVLGEVPESEIPGFGACAEAGGFLDDPGCWVAGLFTPSTIGGASVSSSWSLTLKFWEKWPFYYVADFIDDVKRPAAVCPFEPVMYGQFEVLNMCDRFGMGSPELAPLVVKLDTAVSRLVYFAVVVVAISFL